MMNKENDDLVYDEDDAVDFIFDWLEEEDQERITRDNIDYVMDVIYDYYEKEGLIEEDSTDEASIDEEKMFNFIVKAVKKDKVELTEEDINLILEGEYQYGLSNGIYEEDIED